MGTVGSPSANLWPVFIGIDKGFFAAENIKPDLVYVPASAAVIQQLAAGSLDVTMSTGLVDPIRAVDQGAALALARFEIQAPPYVIMAKPNIKSLKELKGKVISVGGAKDITRTYAERHAGTEWSQAGRLRLRICGRDHCARASAAQWCRSMRRSSCRRPISNSRPPALTTRADHRICAGAAVFRHGR
jgi:hypothetical protein